jgi:hypothetical protein
MGAQGLVTIQVNILSMYKHIQGRTSFFTPARFKSCLFFKCSSLKLERDRGYQQLVAHLQGLDEEGIYNLQVDLSKILNDIESTWEAKHGALMGAKAVMENGNVSDDFEIEIKKKVMDLLIFNL